MQGLESIPTWFGDAMGITEAAAQSILSISVIFMVLLPILYLGRNRRGFVIELITTFLVMGALVGIGWLPFWFLIATIALIAMGVSVLGTKAVTGE